MDLTNRTNNHVTVKSSSKAPFNKSIEEEPGGKHTDADENDDNDVVIMDDYSNKIVPKKEKPRPIRQEKMNLDAAIFADFDMTATRKDELISNKFSDTFKSVLEGFPVTNTKLKSDEQKSSANTLEIDQFVKNDSLNSFKLNLNVNNSKEPKMSEAAGSDDKRISMWAQKMNHPVLKSKIKLLDIQTSNSTKSTLIKKSEPTRTVPDYPKINNQPSQLRPKTAASISNSSIMSMKFVKSAKIGFQKQNNSDFLSKRPTSTKSEFGTHASSLLFDGYEKRTKNESNHSEFYEDDVTSYISPSFRIKKYNLDDENELEKAKKDLFKRYAVFKEIPTNQRPKSHRIIRFASSSRNNLVASAATIRTY